MVGLFTHIKLSYFFMFVALKWLKTSIETLKWKFKSIWTSILLEIDVDLTSMFLKKKHNEYKKIVLEICVSLATKNRSKHNCMFLAKLFETS